MFTLEKFRPINNQVLIQIDAAEESATRTTQSGLVVVEMNKHKGRDCLATVIKVGDRMLTKQGTYVDLKSIFKEGDRILYYRPAGVGIEIDGVQYLLVRAEDIDCIIEDEEV